MAWERDSLYPLFHVPSLLSCVSLSGTRHRKVSGTANAVGHHSGVVITTVHSSSVRLKHKDDELLARVTAIRFTGVRRYLLSRC